MKKLFTLSLFCVVAALAQDCTTSTSIETWIHCRTAKLAGVTLKQKLIGAATSKQDAQPSVSEAAGALLDRTSGPDLASAAFQLVGSGTGTNSEKKSGDTVVSASAYALYTSFTGQRPLDPEVYGKGAGWRRVSFSAGFESPGDEKASTDKYKVAGAKLLLINRRDVSSVYAQKQIDDTLKAMAKQSKLSGTAQLQIIEYLYGVVGNARDAVKFPLPPTIVSQNDFSRQFLSDQELPNTLKGLTQAQNDHIDEILSSSGAVEGAVRQDTATQKGIFNIQHAAQLSVAWQGKLADKDGVDVHRLEAIFDWGVWKHLDLTVNGGFDYRNSHKIGADTRAGRLAGEGRFELNPVSAVARGVNPWVLAFSGEYKWVHGAEDIYKLQGRLEIPIAAGVKLPLSLTYASRTDLIKESEVRGQVGFTVDAAKIAAALLRR
jgi:hypothetical protein